MATVSLQSRVLGSIWGNCVADALGGPVQFMKKGSFAPITDMEFVRPFQQPAGYASSIQQIITHILTDVDLTPMTAP